ncbi:MFS transporter [Streptomyces canus]|uniref:MFS transporter n=1 Tax=Streptomyces canus TaxID=58343 RepID=UPI0033EB13DE
MTAIASVEQTAPPARDRLLLTGVFTVLGIGMAIWGARMPAVKAAAHISNGQLSLVLLGAALGIVIGLQIGGRLAHRYGPSRLLVAPTVGFGLALAVLGQCRALPTLVLGAGAFGLAHGLLDVGSNACAVNVERAYRRRIMSSVHCAYSGGALVGAALVAVTAWVPHGVLFAIGGGIIALAALAAVPVVQACTSLDAAPQASEPAVAPKTTLPRTGVWLLGALAAAVLLGEGAAADWSAVHLRSLGTSEATAAVAYALYSAAMMTGRLIGDRLTTQFGAMTVVRTGAAIAAAGLGAGLVLGTPAAALGGWIALGLGFSTAVPCLISAAGRGGPRAVAAVAATGYVGLLTGPAAIGALACVTTLSASLALPVVLAAAVALTAHRALESR